MEQAPEFTKPQSAEGANVKEAPECTRIRSAGGASQETENGLDLEEGVMTEAEMESLGPDQSALGSTGECKTKKDENGIVHDGIKILPKEFFWLPTSDGMKEGKAVEFVHVTNTHRWKHIPHNLIKTYIEQLGVPADIDPTGNVQDKTCAKEFAKPQ